MHRNADKNDSAIFTIAAHKIGSFLLLIVYPSLRNVQSQVDSTEGNDDHIIAVMRSRPAVNAQSTVSRKVADGLMYRLIQCRWDRAAVLRMILSTI